MEYLVLGPASMGIFTMLGALINIEDDLKNIKEISGSSAGAILGVCLALEIPLYDILDKFLKVDLKKQSQIVYEKLRFNRSRSYKRSVKGCFRLRPNIFRSETKIAYIDILFKQGTYRVFFFRFTP